MFERIKRLFDSQALSKDGVKNAVVRKLITPEQYRMITGEAYED